MLMNKHCDEGCKPNKHCDEGCKPNKHCDEGCKPDKRSRDADKRIVCDLSLRKSE